MKVFIFPGMGATKDMYSKLLSMNDSIIGCNWPAINQKDDFVSLAQKCIDQYEIGENDVVAGCSMGGMVASEIYKLTNCKNLILIGSCMSPKSIPIHGLSSLGSRLISEKFFQLSSKILPYELVTRSSFLTNPNFVKWSLQALYKWKGSHEIDLRNVKTIHGRYDAIIPIWKVKADKILGGGHLIALTHTKDINQFIINSVTEQSISKKST